MNPRHIAFKSLLSLALASSGLQARANTTDGVEFQPIPVNVQNQCSALILKGTNRYKGYAFKMPRVVLSVDKNLEDLFEIIPKGDGSYVLRFGLHFPLTDDSIDLRRNRSNVKISTCNDDVILADLNMAEERQAKLDPQAAAAAAKSDQSTAAGTVYETKIHTLSPLPISKIKISIDGFPGMTHEIGETDNNLLSYSNMDHIATFNIPDEATYRMLKEQLTGQLGLTVLVDMAFGARAANGRVEVSINTKDIAGALEGLLYAQIPGLLQTTPTTGGGQTTPSPMPIPGNTGGLEGNGSFTPLPGGNSNSPFPSPIPDPNGGGGGGGGGGIPGITSAIGDADLRAYIAMAVSRSNLNIKTEQGSDENFNRVAYQIVERIASSIPSLPQIPGQSWNPTNCYYNPTDPTCANGGYNGGGFPFPGGGFGNSGGFGNNGATNGSGMLNTPGPSGLGPQGPRLQPPSAENRKFFNVGAVIQALKRAQTINYVWDNLGDKETFHYTTNVLVRGSIQDPGYKTLTAIAGDLDGAEYTEALKAGEKVIIRVPSKKTLVNNFKLRTSYFSKDELRRYAVHEYFGLLADVLSKDPNPIVDTYNPRTGGYAAVFPMNQDISRLSRWWKTKFKGEDTTPWNYYWGMKELVPETTMSDPTDLAMELGTLKRLPIRVEFSEIGTVYTLSDLATETDLWSGSFQNGQIVMTPKVDLGILRIRNMDKINNPDRTAETYFFQLKAPAPTKNGKTSDGKSLSSQEQYNWVKVNETGALSSEQVGSLPKLENTSVTRSVYVLKVKAGPKGSEEIAPNIGALPGNGNSAETTAPVIVGPQRPNFP